MKIYEELVARGLIAQVTDEEETMERQHFTLDLTRPQTVFMLDISWHCV